jgi:hypothetical protein
VLGETKQVLSSVIRNGYAPTVESARVAEALISGEFPLEMFEAQLTEARVAANVRKWSMDGSRPQGVNGPIGTPNPNQAPNAYGNAPEGSYQLPYHEGDQKVGEGDGLPTAHSPQEMNEMKRSGKYTPEQLDAIATRSGMRKKKVQ